MWGGSNTGLRLGRLSKLGAISKPVTYAQGSQVYCVCLACSPARGDSGSCSMQDLVAASGLTCIGAV